jgi:serine/threonine-protein kinase ATR
MASLQSTLGIGELREETLKTWALFVRTLRFADIGPFVGRTTAALVANWKTFTPPEILLAMGIIDDIAGNAPHLSAYFDEIVGMDNIPELRSSASRLTDYRRTWDLRTQLDKLLERTRSKNAAVATTSMSELRALLRRHQSSISQLSQGDTFDAIIGRMMSSLISASSRDGDCQELRDLSHECMGILGALDPDRFVAEPAASGMTIMSNFADQDESIDFAIHLIRDLLVDAFRATNDTKHQNHLAFAIQELLKFCGFTPKVLQPSLVPLKLRAKWQMLPKDQLETLTPLLESRFSLNDTSIRAFPHPIYPAAPTYREWVQMWTSDLVGRVIRTKASDRATVDSQLIFGVCRGVLRNQDVTVAHHLLPHLVLNVLLTGDHASKDEICQEINTVLQDQVNSLGGQDKRMLSAQVIFDLMDHLSTWLRHQRVGRSDRGAQTKIVEGVLSSIETELMANAALQSKAYARSLRNFEQRIVHLRKERRSNSELQTYFERLHQIYAELDEPDGMQGVSTFVISPSLEHQIREHETTGQWTSAQSCWEVRLQQSPEDVNLHLGLLKCLRNLGHYGE